ncbi:hypothetical protein BSPA111_39900 [Buttiauxella sp. A111]|nr:hypothetical protein BSPA111_39900 [Buttiauxella sp. A111]
MKKTTDLIVISCWLPGNIAKIVIRNVDSYINFQNLTLEMKGVFEGRVEL